jgi:UDP-N-acetyl-D-mannosaminuronate dehydrogenase
VQAHDPAVKTLPDELAGQIALCPTVEATLRSAEVAVVATGWPEYRDLRPDDVIGAMRAPLVLDAAHFLAKTLGTDSRIRYYAVGKP